MARRRVEVYRVYDVPMGDIGHRVLVDRLWPRGLSRHEVPVDEWNKVIAPSTQLRRWYGHNAARFEEFSRRYRAELENPEPAEHLARLTDLARHETVVLMTATRDVEHSHARVLRDYLLGAETTDPLPSNVVVLRPRNRPTS